MLRPEKLRKGDQHLLLPWRRRAPDHQLTSKPSREVSLISHIRGHTLDMLCWSGITCFASLQWQVEGRCTILCPCTGAMCTARPTSLIGRYALSFRAQGRVRSATTCKPVVAQFQAPNASTDTAAGAVSLLTTVSVSASIVRAETLVFSLQ